MIRFGVLGPLDIRVEDRTVDLGGPRQRALLAALLLHAREPVSAEALAQMLWGDEAPAGAAKALQVNVSRLRAALGAAGDRVETVSGGYRLRVEPGELDAETFAQTCERARALPPAEAAQALRAALASWRGPALADLRYEAWAQGEVRRLEELRGAAIEERIAAELALGEHTRLAGELEALVAEHPLRERLRGLQMLALYRSGRHADALAAYRALRETLDTELGLEPGPELRKLEQQILTHDSTLLPESETSRPPELPTATFGRDDDVHAVLGLLDDTRLVTLTGPGGVGKTRLALEVAHAAGGCWVPLAATADDDQIPAVICNAIGVARMPGETDAEALDRALSRGPLLLVLDNLEHLDAPPLLAMILERHAELRVLGTSRQPVRIRAERVFPVAPLSSGSDESPAVAMFVDRARAQDPSFGVTTENLPAVTEICRRVDGLPLAIELAAARLGLLAPSELAERLTDALAVLDHGPQDAPERHRTLRATLDWSLALLDDDECAAFSALGVFVGGCDLAAAQAVTGNRLAVLEALVAKGLVVRRDGRLTLLEPIRQYAAEHLAARPDASSVRAAHLAHYRALVEGVEHELFLRRRLSPAFARVRAEHDNMRVALQWALDSGATDDALALAGELGTYGWLTYRSAEVQGWCERTLTAAGADAPPHLRARVLHALTLNDIRNPPRLAQAAEAVELLRAADDESWTTRALVILSNARSFTGDFDGGRVLAEEALQRARGIDDALVGTALGQLALALPVAEAVPHLRDAIRLLEAAGASTQIAGLLSTLGMAALREEEYAVAHTLVNEALEAAQRTGETLTLGLVWGNVGLAALLTGDLAAAGAAFSQQLSVARAQAFANYYDEGLFGLAAVAAAGGDDTRAAILQAAARRQRYGDIGKAEAPVYLRIEARFLDPARERLGAVAWDAAAATGAGMSADEALAYALEDPAVSGC